MAILAAEELDLKVGRCQSRRPPHNYAVGKSYFLVVLIAMQGRNQELQAIAAVVVVDTFVLGLSIIAGLEVTTGRELVPVRAKESLGWH